VTGDQWDHDVFICHAGTIKTLALAVESELEGLGFKAFVDKTSLFAGNKADQKMENAAQRAAIGLVLFNQDFFTSKWPMRELKLILEADTLLPVIVGMNHDELVGKMREKGLPQRDFTTVNRTTCLEQEGKGEKELVQKTCLAVVRAFVEKVCPSLPDSRRSGEIIRKALEAVMLIKDEKKLLDITRRDAGPAKGWIDDLRFMLSRHPNVA
jgi:hypothetical protein